MPALFYRRGPEICSDEWLEGGERRCLLSGANMSLSCFTAVYRRADLAHDAAYFTTYITPCRPVLSHQPLHIYYGRYMPIEPLIVAWKMSETPIKLANFGGVPLSVHLSDYMKQQPTGIIQQSAYDKQWDRSCAYHYYGRDGQHDRAKVSHPDGSD